MRSYVPDDLKIQKLFADIIAHLSHGGTQSDIILGLLKDVCAHFRFGGGLVYEIDHTGTFNLIEHHFAYRNPGRIPQSLRLEEHLNEDDLVQLHRDQVFVIQPQVDRSYQHSRLTAMISANSLLLSPVLVDRRLVALVAMLDRRQKILMTPEAVETAKTVLRLLATHVRVRFIQKRLSQAQSSLTSILDHMGVDVYVSDYETREVLFANQSLAANYGGQEAVIGRPCYEVFSGGDLAACRLCPRDRLLDDDGRPRLTSTWEYQRPQDDSWQRVYSAAFPWVDGRMAQVTTSIDISDSKRNEALINRQAFYDQLTQLPNRRKLYQDCEEQLPALAEKGGHAWILFFDLDNFKQVNDTLGHQAGDELLLQIGRFFDGDPDARGRFYRLGGDEFILFLGDVSRKYVLAIVDRLLLRSGRPWKLSNGRPVCRTSIGIARFPEDGRSIEELLHQADLALYQAKAAGKGRAFFSDGRFTRNLDNLLKAAKKAGAGGRPGVKKSPAAGDGEGTGGPSSRARAAVVPGVSAGRKKRS